MTSADFGIGTYLEEASVDRTLSEMPLYFPIDEHFPPKYVVKEDIRLDDFSSLEYLSEGKTSVIFRATWGEEKVIVKMLHTLRLTDEAARSEFMQEYQLLVRCEHRNIIRVLGYGVAQVHPMTTVEEEDDEDRRQSFVESGTSLRTNDR